jgi:hypothetical protein
MVLVCMWSGMRTKSCNVKTPRLRWSDSLCCSSSTRSQVYLTAFATNINSWMISVRRSSIGIILFVKMLSERELSPLPFSTPSSSSLIVRRATASSPGFPDLKKSACRLLRRGNTGHTNIEPNPSHNSSHKREASCKRDTKCQSLKRCQDIQGLHKASKKFTRVA